MKKVFAVVLAVALMMTLAVSAFALESPVADEKVKAVVVMGDKAPVVATLDDANVVTATADPSMGDFLGWSFFKKDGTDAVEGTDYALVSAGSGDIAALAVAKVSPLLVAVVPSVTDTTVTVKVMSDLIIVANYANKTPDMQAAMAMFNATSGDAGDDNGNESPATGDVATAALAGAAVVVLAGALVAKKRLAD